MPITFVAYIDQSGDTGLELVKKPDNPHRGDRMVCSLGLSRQIENDPKMVTWINDVQEQFTSKRTDLHFNKLLAFKKPLVCSRFREEALRSAFVVMSNKKNIEKYQNPHLDDGNKAWIYWFLTRLLFERVTAYLRSTCPDRTSRGRQTAHHLLSTRRSYLHRF